MVLNDVQAPFWLPKIAMHHVEELKKLSEMAFGKHEAAGSAGILPAATRKTMRFS